MTFFNPLQFFYVLFAFVGVFGLGFLNKSTSKTEQKTYTTTNNTNLQGVEGNALAFSSSSGNTVNLTDGGAIAAAFNFASKASENALDFAYNAGAPDAAISEKQLYIGGGVLLLLGLVFLNKRGKKK